MGTMNDLLETFVTECKDRFTANEWLYTDEMMLYVRKGHHYLEGCRCVTLDMASFEVYNKGQGIFTAFLQEAHAKNKWDATFIECVHNPRLRRKLERHGFHLQPDSMPGSYYLWSHEPIIMPKALVSQLEVATESKKALP